MMTTLFLTIADFTDGALPERTPLRSKCSDESPGIAAPVVNMPLAGRFRALCISGASGNSVGRIAVHLPDREASFAHL